MPPPIQSQSGSRAALVTWTVVSSILFVVMTVLAIFSNVAANKANQEKQSLQQKYAGVVTEGELNGEAVTQLTSIKTADPATYTGGALNVALTQRDLLAKKVGGTSTDAVTKADELIKKAKAIQSLKVTGDSLTTVGNTLVTAVTERDARIKQLEETEKATARKLATVTTDFQSQLSAAQADTKKAQDATADVLKQIEAYRGTSDQSVASLQQAADANKKLADDTINQLSAQAQEAAAKAKKQEDSIKALQGKLRDIRQPVDQILRQADAHVMRISGDGMLYLDLGTGDGVSAGMTFELYDRVLGIPKPGDPTNDENLPKGKASIEVVKVAAGSSECRIIRQTPGETVVEGDAAVNLVFDKNIKYNVMVYGNFDLDRNGQATAADADVIKRLVTRWGGKIVTTLNADTDFLVIGKVPEVPTPSQEELDRPEVQFELDRKKKELADYDDVLAQAIQLNIPVLNQNRFLYFTGYYEQSAR